MPCEICGRNSCTRYFHGNEEQTNFDAFADGIKERMKEVLKSQIQRLPDVCADESFCGVNLDDVISLIDSYS